MNELENPFIVEFPLRGEWMAPNTPGTIVPSQGTDQLGQRYAYDFLQIDWNKKGMHFYNTGKIKYFLWGVPLNKCFCWDKEVYAPYTACHFQLAKNSRHDFAKKIVQPT